MNHIIGDVIALPIEQRFYLTHLMIAKFNHKFRVEENWGRQFLQFDGDETVSAVTLMKVWADGAVTAMGGVLK